jgi:hypothetical protein
MPTLTDAKLRELAESLPEAAWPTLVARQPEVRARLGAALDALPGPVAAPLVARLEAGDREGWGFTRAALQAAGLGTSAGVSPVAWLGEHTLALAGPAGEAALSVLAFALPGDGLGSGADLRRLVESLEGVLDARRFAVHVRRPLPVGFDPAPVAHAVSLWVRALRQHGEAQGCAAYEDGDVSVEVCVVEGAPPAGRSGRLAVVPPRRSLERMAEIDARLMAAVTEAEAARGGRPLVAALVADGPWPVSRGYAQQVFYGTPTEIRTISGVEHPSYEASFASTGLALFSDPLARALGAVWWVEPEGAPPEARGWSYLNPWASVLGAPGLPGRRYAAVGEPVGAKREVTMRWHEAPLVSWRPA